jgi:hypothetical protein
MPAIFLPVIDPVTYLYKSPSLKKQLITTALSMSAFPRLRVSL